MKNVNHTLDNQSLLLIFDRLSVKNLLRAGRVCSRCNTIRSKAALSRKSLTLLVGPNALKGIESSDIRKIPHFELLTNLEDNPQIALPDVNEVISNTQSRLQIHSVFSSFHVNFLSQLFANVQHFTISFPDTNDATAISNIPLVNYLLVQWTAKLVTLKLYVYTISADERIIQTQLHQNRQLLLIINSMASLKVLHLDLTYPTECEGEFEKENVVLMFAFVKRLTEFHFDFDFELGLSKYLFDALNVHGDGISDIAIPFSFDNQFLRIKPELANRFSQIDTTIYNAQTELEYLGKHFTNLTILHISFEKLHLTANLPNIFYRSMASLKQLVYLCIGIYDEDVLVQLQVHDQTDLKTRYGTDHINSSVKILKFSIYCNQIGSYDIFRRLCLYHFFPNTQVFNDSFEF